MKKTQRIREHVAAHPDIDADGISSATGIDLAFVQTICSQRTRAGEFIKRVDGDHSFYALNPNYKKHVRRPPRAAKASKANRATKRARKHPPPRVLRDIHVPTPGRTTGTTVMRDAILQVYREAGADLRKAVRECVDGVESEPTLSLALAAHQRAEHLLDIAA